MTNYELYHHGILGQKWGIRRYQNEDGTLTSAGKKRYSDGETLSTHTKKTNSGTGMHPLIGTLVKGSAVMLGEAFVYELLGGDSVIGALAAISVPVTSVATGVAFCNQILNEYVDPLRDSVVEKKNRN